MPKGKDDDEELDGDEDDTAQDEISHQASGEEDNEVGVLSEKEILDMAAKEEASAIKKELLPAAAGEDDDGRVFFSHFLQRKKNFALVHQAACKPYSSILSGDSFSASKQIDGHLAQVTFH